MLLFALFACAPWTPLTGDDVCVEVQTAVAARTFACTGDSALADERYLAVADYTCRWGDTEVDDPSSNLQVTDMTDCVAAIQSVTCEDVEALGDDPAFWLNQSDRCLWLYDGVGVPQAQIDDSWTGR